MNPIKVLKTAHNQIKAAHVNLAKVRQKADRPKLLIAQNRLAQVGLLIEEIAEELNQAAQNSLIMKEILQSASIGLVKSDDQYFMHVIVDNEENGRQDWMIRIVPNLAQAISDESFIEIEETKGVEHDLELGEGGSI